MQKEPNQRSILIAREGIHLGALSEPEIRKLLAAGFLLPTDLFRRPEDSQWKRLIELEQEVKRRADVKRFIKKYRGCIHPITEQIAGNSRALTAKVRSYVLNKRTALTAGSRRVLTDYLPQIRNRVTEQLVARPASTVRSALRDDQLMRKIFGAVYDCLPKPVYRFIPEGVFIEFCLQNKARLFATDAAHDGTSARGQLHRPADPTNQTHDPINRPTL
jgi:hypothetical protein